MTYLKRISLFALALLLALGVFFACDGEGNPSETEDGTDSGTVEGSDTVSGTEEPMEVVSYELASKTTSAKIELRDGQPYVVSLKTESGVEKAGEPVPFNLPSLGKNVTWTHTSTDDYDDGDGGIGYVFHYKNDDLQVTYDLYAVARPDMAGPFEFFGTVTNNGAEAYERFTPRSYFSVRVDGEAAPTAWTFRKESGLAEGYDCVKYSSETYDAQQYQGTGIYHTVLEKGKNALAYTNTNYLWNLNGDIPMMYLDYGTSGVYFAHEWTHANLYAEGDGEGGALLSAYIGSSEGRFKTRIPAGESLYLPSIYLGVYDGDVDVGSNVFKHWFLRYKAPDNMYENPSEPLAQVDVMTIDMRPQVNFDARNYGFELIKWDYGWWDDGAGNGIGTTEVRLPTYLMLLEQSGCTTIEEYVTKAKENGLDVTMYFLLRDTRMDRPDVPTSVGQYGHPEWFGCLTMKEDRDAADLGDEACVAFYKDYMYEFFSKNHISTWRSDFEPILSSSYLLSENRHYADGDDIAYWCTVGFRDLVDHLLDNIENFRYESCSAGGSMKDLFTATKASVINCDDSSDFMSLHMSFYDSSYVFHPAQLSLPVDALTYTPGSQYHTGIGDYVYGLRCTLTGAIMAAHWDGITDVERENWSKYIGDIYVNKMRPLIRNGDLYHILPRPDGVHWDGLQYIDLDAENETIGMVLLWKPTDTEGSQKTVKLRGLEADASYQLTFEDRPEQSAVYTGARLMEGLTVTIEGDFGSEMIWISRADS